MKSVRTLLYALIVTCLLMMVDVEARKTYLLKEGIEQGKIKVKQPRVMVSDVKWCFLKDDNNEYCIEGDTNMKFEFSSNQAFEKSYSTIAPRFNHTFNYGLV